MVINLSDDDFARIATGIRIMAIVAIEQRRSTHGECCSEFAFGICRFAGVHDVKKLLCGAPTGFYTLCPYSASNNSFIPIYDPNEIS